MSQLASLNDRVAQCTACELHRGRTRSVPGEGPENAAVVFIGEGPGYNEDQQGRPFIGQAGKLLDEMIALAGLRREDVYITNIVKCRPPANRDPLPVEIDTCTRLYLDEQLVLIQPRFVVTLGRYSMQRFFAGQTISKIHGRPKTVANVTYMPMYHPAAALRQNALRETLAADFRTLGEIVRQSAEQIDTGPAPAAPPQEQLRLLE